MSCTKAYLLTGLMFTAALADPPRPLGEGPTAPTAPSAQQAAQNDPQRYSSPYWNGGSSDLPAADIRAVAPARAQATATKWEYNQSLDDLAYALRVDAMQFDLRPDVVAAMNEEQAAYNDLQKERKRALAPLSDNAAYMASNQLSSNVSDQIQDERDADHPNPVRLIGMATVRMNYVQDNRKLEASILDRDDGYQKARQRYVDASSKVRDLRKAEALAVMTDAKLSTLRHQVAQARIDKLAAAAYLDGVVNAQDIALGYAGYYRRTGYLNNAYYGNGLYGGYYGGAYGGGFGFRY